MVVRSDIERKALLHATGLPPALRSCVLVAALAIGGSAAAACLIDPSFGPVQFAWLTARFFRQDLLWLSVTAGLLVILAVTPLPTIGWRRAPSLVRHRWAVPLILAGMVAAIGVLGSYLVFQGYHLARDEALAEFDAQIFRAGRLIAPIDPQWRSLAEALAPRFMLPIFGNPGFVSEYLPVNAALRAAVGSIADPNWTSPLLAAVAVLAAFAAGRRLWPAQPAAALLAALLVASSPQVLVTSMTSYAMTGHLAFNLLWLAFFLRDDKVGHGAAIATGWAACGLHQVIFHPLFVAPFIVRLWTGGRSRLAILYIASYAGICLFWVSYWKLVIATQGAAPQVSDGVGVTLFLLRAVYVVKDFDWAGLGVMLKNILRFVAWQNPILLPLCLLGFRAVRHGTGKAPELFWGLGLTMLAMFILLPYQGHGWGYRYLHGLIGSAALLAAYGWVGLFAGEGEGGSENGQAAARSMVALCTVVAWLVLLPAQGKAAHDFVAPYATAEKLIRQAPADLVVVDTSKMAFAEDLVSNDPFLRNRPLILDLSNLGPSDIERICRGYSVAVFDDSVGQALGIAIDARLTAAGDPERARLRALLTQLRCRILRMLADPSQAGTQR